MKTHGASLFLKVQGSLAILRLPQVKARRGKLRSSIYADIKSSRFVAPINIGPRAVGWLAHEVDHWIAARIAREKRECEMSALDMARAAQLAPEPSHESGQPTSNNAPGPSDAQEGQARDKAIAVWLYCIGAISQEDTRAQFASNPQWRSL